MNVAPSRPSASPAEAPRPFAPMRTLVHASRSNFTSILVIALFCARLAYKHSNASDALKPADSIPVISRSAQSSSELITLSNGTVLLPHLFGPTKEAILNEPPYGRLWDGQARIAP
ncbi:hypothetical protein IPJ72_02705 [Candidatus Peregrinibacteria bacterium]|nr:MAG: hypothetical protein IPJ72_02705 [Candidatus Peregrinibacteria bacterium]